MSLLNEAGYLYVLSKDLMSVNKKIRKHAQKAREHFDDHTKATRHEDKQKHYVKHTDATAKVRKLAEKHNEILRKIQRHQVAFAHSLRDETKLT
ncbi:hypothetical protein HYV86_05250 [Candidatus Woesearchaeota archaeon]|nr:hypothetical protein [Candidatus Woesearchaeota archaeon]